MIRRNVVVCPLRWYYSPAHLEEVMREMERLGPPRLRGHLDRVSGAFLLREGTHRIRAAQALGLVPVLVPERWPKTRRALEAARVAARTRGLLLPEVILETFEGALIDLARDPRPALVGLVSTWPAP